MTDATNPTVGGESLLPCPFCGADGHIRSLASPAGKLFWGECIGEEKCVALNAEYTLEEAAAKWNTRATITKATGADQ